MNFRLNIKMNGTDKALAHLQNAENIQLATMAAAQHFRAKIAIYPPVRRGPAVFESIEEMRGFFAKLNAGEIEVPYVRGISPGSERLGQKWTVRPQGSTSAKVENNASYAGKVQGEEQHPYHRRTGWPTVKKTLRQEGGRMGEIIGEQIMKLPRR